MPPGALSTARPGSGVKRPALRLWSLAVALVWACLCAHPASAADTLSWNTNQSRVSADIQAGNLVHVLSQIAAATGWQVFVEPHSARVVSTKFSDLPPGEAMRLLMGDLNFALVPSTNSRSKLFVFRSSLDKATQLVAPTQEAKRKAKVIANELIVRLKPGMKIDDLAKALGAKVIGRIDSLNAYRLQFEDASAAAAASAQLAANPDVASVENNYATDRPEPMQGVLGSAAQPLSLTLDPPPANGRTVIGLVDTAVQPLGNGLDAFLQQQISVAGQAQLDPTTPSHGTAVAETLLSALQTLQDGHSSVQILPVDVYGPSESTTSFDIALGIQAAINKGANPINVSSGGPGDSAILSDLVAQANEKGIVIYAAKGNDGTTELIYPAAYPGVNAVTALGSDGLPAIYANRANIPAIGAPGTSIIPFGNMSWVVQGTSVSAPIATATDVVLGLQQNLTPKQANQILLTSPTPLTRPSIGITPVK